MPEPRADASERIRRHERGMMLGQAVCLAVLLALLLFFLLWPLRPSG